MDHLPLNEGIGELRVPYFDHPEWDGQDVATWLQRLGWNFAFIKSDLQGRSILQYQAMVKSWLYLGLLKAFTGVHFERNSFLVESDKADTEP